MVRKIIRNMSVNYVDAAKDGIKTQALLKQNYKTL